MYAVLFNLYFRFSLFHSFSTCFLSISLFPSLSKCTLFNNVCSSILFDYSTPFSFSLSLSLLNISAIPSYSILFKDKYLLSLSLSCSLLTWVYFSRALSQSPSLYAWFPCSFSSWGVGSALPCPPMVTLSLVWWNTLKDEQMCELSHTGWVASWNISIQLSPTWNRIN